MSEDGARFDSGFDDSGPFRDTPEPGGVSLEAALHDFGPAAIDDLIPRLRAVARRLDAAHAAGIIHGALHPSRIIVYDEVTSVVAGKESALPYIAPEVMAGQPATAASDQFSLAAMAFEWLFGRTAERHGDRAIEIRTMPGIDRGALSKAFTRALAPNPRDRFASCTDFCNALSAAVVPELPLLALEPESDDDPVEPFVPASLDAELTRDDAHELLAQDAVAGATAQPDLDVIDPHLSAPAVAPVPSWNPGPAPTSSHDGQRFGGLALILATLVGAVFGFAAGYMARPRALQSGPPQEIAAAPAAATQRVVAPPQPVTPAPESKKAAAKAETKVVEPVGRLLVRSTPTGASVSVDGVAKGVTPLALRELAMGTRNITVARRGYLPETRKVVITSARPARSLDVRLAAEASAPLRPRTAATLGKSAAAATTGGLSIDSRPLGASVTVNGRPSGTTPLALNDLAPGDYRILMSMAGYRNFATTVRVVAGERARAAASLTALEQQ